MGERGTTRAAPPASGCWPTSWPTSSSRAGARRLPAARGFRGRRSSPASWRRAGRVHRSRPPRQTGQDSERRTSSSCSPTPTCSPTRSADRSMEVSRGHAASPRRPTPECSRPRRKRRGRRSHPVGASSRRSSRRSPRHCHRAHRTAAGRRSSRATPASRASSQARARPRPCQEEQHGVLTEAQERNIDMLAALDPGAAHQAGLPAARRGRGQSPRASSSSPRKWPICRPSSRCRSSPTSTASPSAAPSRPPRRTSASWRNSRPKMEHRQEPENRGRTPTGSSRSQARTDCGPGQERAATSAAEPPPTAACPRTVEAKGGMPSLSKVVIKPGKKGEETTEPQRRRLSGRRRRHGPVRPDAARHDQPERGDADHRLRRRRRRQPAVQGPGGQRKATELLPGHERAPGEDKTAKKKDVATRSGLGGQERKQSLLKAPARGRFRQGGERRQDARRERPEDSRSTPRRRRPPSSTCTTRSRSARTPSRPAKKKATAQEEGRHLEHGDGPAGGSRPPTTAKPMLQQAKMSTDVVDVARAGTTDGQKTFVQEKLDRFPGTAPQARSARSSAGILKRDVGTSPSDGRHQGQHGRQGLHGPGTARRRAGPSRLPSSTTSGPRSPSSRLR